jgi:hypothetical protein
MTKNSLKLPKNDAKVWRLFYKNIWKFKKYCDIIYLLFCVAVRRGK